jgi:ABC-type antimicrobial peptide transport system permease subunit
MWFRTLAQRTYSVGLMTAFTGLALLLCVLGIYGVVSYVTLQRTREFGIRMALGASRRDVLRNVLHQGGALVVSGAIVGFGVSLVATRELSQILFETSPFDPMIFASSMLLLGLVGLLACLLPGMRAAPIEPREALNAA